GDAEHLAPRRDPPWLGQRDQEVALRGALHLEHLRRHADGRPPELHLHHRIHLHPVSARLPRDSQREERLATAGGHRRAPRAVVDEHLPRGAEDVGRQVHRRALRPEDDLLRELDLAPRGERAGEARQPRDVEDPDHVLTSTSHRWGGRTYPTSWTSERTAKVECPFW